MRSDRHLLVEHNIVHFVDDNQSIAVARARFIACYTELYLLVETLIEVYQFAEAWAFVVEEKLATEDHPDILKLMKHCGVVHEDGHNAALPTSWRKLHDHPLRSFAFSCDCTEGCDSSSLLFHIWHVAASE